MKTNIEIDFKYCMKHSCLSCKRGYECDNRDTSDSTEYKQIHRENEYMGVSKGKESISTTSETNNIETKTKDTNKEM